MASHYWIMEYDIDKNAPENYRVISFNNIFHKVTRDYPGYSNGDCFDRRVTLFIQLFYNTTIQCYKSCCMLR